MMSWRPLRSSAHHLTTLYFSYKNPPFLRQEVDSRVRNESLTSFHMSNKVTQLHLFSHLRRSSHRNTKQCCQNLRFFLIDTKFWIFETASIPIFHCIDTPEPAVISHSLFLSDSSWHTHCCSDHTGSPPKLLKWIHIDAVVLNLQYTSLVTLLFY